MLQSGRLRLYEERAGDAAREGGADGRGPEEKREDLTKWRALSIESSRILVNTQLLIVKLGLRNRCNQ